MLTANPDRGHELSRVQAHSPLFTSSSTLAGQITLTISASLFVALCAHVSVHLPFTPIPFTLSDFAVILVGLTLGPVVGFSALILYLIEGSLGLPVFTPGGLGGLAQLLGPTGGYLLAYPFAAALAGALRRLPKGLETGFPVSLLAAASASALLMITGVLWLKMLGHLSLSTAFRFGALPFLPGQLAKVLSAAGLFTTLRRWNRA